MQVVTSIGKNSKPTRFGVIVCVATLFASMQGCDQVERIVDQTGLSTQAQFDQMVVPKVQTLYASYKNQVETDIPEYDKMKMQYVLQWRINKILIDFQNHIDGDFSMGGTLGKMMRSAQKQIGSSSAKFDNLENLIKNLDDKVTDGNQKLTDVMNENFAKQQNLILASTKVLLTEQVTQRITARRWFWKTFLFTPGPTWFYAFLLCLNLGLGIGFNALLRYSAKFNIPQETMEKVRYWGLMLLPTSPLLFIWSTMLGAGFGMVAQAWSFGDILQEHADKSPILKVMATGAESMNVLQNQQYNFASVLLQGSDFKKITKEYDGPGSIKKLAECVDDGYAVCPVDVKRERLYFLAFTVVQFIWGIHLFAILPNRIYNGDWLFYQSDKTVINKEVQKGLAKVRDEAAMLDGQDALDKMQASNDALKAEADSKKAAAAKPPKIEEPKPEKTK